MREAIPEEYIEVMDNLVQVEEVRQKLTSCNQFLQAWNGDLIKTLIYHGINIPDAPELQYT
jgi:hypothetical protein